MMAPQFRIEELKKGTIPVQKKQPPQAEPNITGVQSWFIATFSPCHCSLPPHMPRGQNGLAVPFLRLQQLHEHPVLKAAFSVVADAIYIISLSQQVWAGSDHEGGLAGHPRPWSFQEFFKTAFSTCSPRKLRKTELTMRQSSLGEAVWGAGERNSPITRYSFLPLALWRMKAAKSHLRSCTW